MDAADARREDLLSALEVIEQQPLAGVVDRPGERVAGDGGDAVGVTGAVFGEFDDAEGGVATVGDVTGDAHRRSLTGRGHWLGHARRCHTRRHGQLRRRGPDSSQA